MSSNHLIFCCTLLLLPSIFPIVRVFSNELTLYLSWPKYLSFSFRISPFNEYSRLISFRSYWFDLLAVQGPLESLLQHHSSKTSNSSLLSFRYHPTPISIHDYQKNQSFDCMNICGQSNVSVFDVLSSLVIIFLPGRKSLLISWFLWPSSVILELKKIKSVTVSIVSPSICREVMGLDAIIFVFVNVEF